MFCSGAANSRDPFLVTSISKQKTEPFLFSTPAANLNHISLVDSSRQKKPVSAVLFTHAYAHARTYAHRSIIDSAVVKRINYRAISIAQQKK